MRTSLVALFLSLPSAAWAMYGPGGPAGGCGSCSGGLLAGAAYALVAVLGYWVLLQAVKEAGSVCIRRVGDVLGSILVIVGLLGFLCAVTSHCKSSMRLSCSGPGPEMMMPPGHPPIPPQFKPGQPMSPAAKEAPKPAAAAPGKGEKAK